MEKFEEDFFYSLLPALVEAIKSVMLPPYILLPEEERGAARSAVSHLFLEGEMSTSELISLMIQDGYSESLAKRAIFDTLSNLQRITLRQSKDCLLWSVRKDAIPFLEKELKEDGISAQEIKKAIVNLLSRLGEEVRMAKPNHIPLLREILLVSGGLPADNLVQILQDKDLQKKQAMRLLSNQVHRGTVSRESQKRTAIVTWVGDFDGASAFPFSADQFPDIFNLRPRPGEVVQVIITMRSGGSDFMIRQFKETKAGVY